MTTTLAPRPAFRGFSHQMAFASALTLAPLLIVATPGIGPRLVTSVYAVAVVGLFGVSALYHRGPWGERGRAVMRRLDHSMIFVAIAATYTPIAAFALPSSTARWILPVVWAGAAIGVAGRMLWISAPSFVVTVPYVALGWVAVFATPQIIDGLGGGGFALIAHKTGSLFCQCGLAGMLERQK